jgi:hypothetical protein
MLCPWEWSTRCSSFSHLQDPARFRNLSWIFQNPPDSRFNHFLSWIHCYVELSSLSQLYRVHEKSAGLVDAAHELIPSKLVAPDSKLHRQYWWSLVTIGGPRWWPSVEDYQSCRGAELPPRLASLAAVFTCESTLGLVQQLG